MNKLLTMSREQSSHRMEYQKDPRVEAHKTIFEPSINRLQTPRNHEAPIGNMRSLHVKKSIISGIQWSRQKKQ